MQTFALRLLLRWRALQARHRFDIVFDNQCLAWGLLGIRAAGTPVVSVIHHPLHIDREADFAIDPAFLKKLKRTLYFPLLMQRIVAPRLDKIVTVSEASRREIERYFGIPEKSVSVVYNGTDSELFRPIPGTPKQTDLLFVGRTEDRKKGIGTLLEALAKLPREITLKIVDGTDSGRRARDAADPAPPARGPRGAAPPHARAARAGGAVLDGARRRGAVLLRGLRLPRQRGDGVRAARDRERRRRAARGGRDRRQGRAAGARRATPGRSPPRSATCSPIPTRAEAMGRAARARVERVFQWRDAAARLIEVFEETLRAAHRRPRPT